MPAPAAEDRLSNAALAGLVVSLIAMGTSTFTTLGLGALAPYLRTSLHLSTFEVGALPALVFLGALTVSSRAGHLTDRIGAGRALIVSQLGVAAGVAIAATAPGRAIFLAGVGLAGIGYGAVNPATNVLSTSLVPRRRRGLFLERQADRGHVRRARRRDRAAAAGRCGRLARGAVIPIAML